MAAPATTRPAVTLQDGRSWTAAAATMHTTSRPTPQCTDSSAPHQYSTTMGTSRGTGDPASSATTSAPASPQTATEFPAPCGCQA